MDALADEEADEELNEHFKNLDKARDGRTGTRRRYVYFVVIIPEELLLHIKSDSTELGHEIYNFLRDHEDDETISVQLYVGRNGR